MTGGIYAGSGSVVLWAEILNPFIPYQAKQSSLHKVKTDAVDAYRLGQLFYKEELAPVRQRGKQLLDLRHLTRQREAVTGLFVQAKLPFQSALDAVFPAYADVFGTLFSGGGAEDPSGLPNRRRGTGGHRYGGRQNDSRPVPVGLRSGRTPRRSSCGQRPNATRCGRRTSLIRPSACACTSG